MTLPEPRWVPCAACAGRVDRHEPHVTWTWQLEVLTPDGEHKVAEAHPDKAWHPTGAPAAWVGAR